MGSYEVRTFEPMPGTLHIKNMVCNRCIMVVTDLLGRSGLHPERVELGVATIAEESLSPEQQQQLDQALKDHGFELLDDKRAQLIDRMKLLVIQTIHHQDQLVLKTNWSHLFSENLHYDYHYLSTLFSSTEGITVEQYIIRQKIERVKELLFYDELQLNEIADKLGYSSVQHLSNQFKKVTGLTPSAFRKSLSDGNPRKPLDQVSASSGS